MNKSYFTYFLDDLSLFSEKENIKSLKRHFTGFPFDEKAKKIISKVTEKKQLIDTNKLKQEEALEQEKRLSTGRDFKTGPISQEIYEKSSTVYMVIFVIFFCLACLYSFNLTLKIEISSVFKYIFFYMNILAGLTVFSGLKLFNKKNRKKYKKYYIFLITAIVLFIITSILSIFIFPEGNYAKYTPFVYFTLLPFLLFSLTGLFSVIFLFFIRILLKLSNLIEISLIKNKKVSDLKNIKDEIEEIENKIDIINEEIDKTNVELSDEKIQLIKELSQKYKHIFFSFTSVEEEKKDGIIQANQAIAIGDYLKAINIVKKLMGDDVDHYLAYHFWQGINKTEDRKFTEGEKHFNVVIKSLPLLTDVQLALSFLYIKSNKASSVETLMKREPLLSYNNSEKFFLKGLALFIEGKYGLSELDFQKALSMDPENNTIKIFLFLTLLKLKNYKKLTKLLKDFSVSDNIKDLFFGVTEYKQKNYNKAIEYFNKILNSDPYHIESICFRELSIGQKKVHPFFRKKKLPQKLISNLPDSIDKMAVANYTIARLYQLDGDSKKSLEYLEKAYKSDSEHPEITVDLAKFYFRNPYDNVLEIEVMLKAIPLMGGKKRFFRNLLTHLLSQSEVDERILNLIETQYFKDICYDPLMVKVLAKNYLKKDKMDDKSSELFLKAIEIKAMIESDQIKAEKLIAWHDAENGRINLNREDLYKKLLKKYPRDERLLFLNSALLSKKKKRIEKNPGLFKDILNEKYINSKFWEIFKLKRKDILLELVYYYKEEKIYADDNKDLIEEAYNIFSEDKIILTAFGEYSVKTGRYDRKVLETYKEIYKKDPDNTDNLVALGKSLIECGEINFESIAILEEIFSKELAWDEATKVLTEHYIQKRKDGKLKKEFIVLFVWGKYTELDPHDYLVRFYIAEELFERKDYLQASEKYEEVISLSPKHRDASYKLGECYLHMERVEDAIETFKKILTYRNDIETLGKLAKIYLEIYQDEKEAALYYEKASKIDTNNLAHLKTLLELYKKDRDISNMIKIQEKITSLEPSGENLATLGHHYLKTNRLEKGINKLERAIKKGFYAGGKVYLMIGEAKYYIMGQKSKERDWEELIEILSQAIKFGCRDKKVYEMRYQAYLKTGNKSKAAEDRKVFAPDDLDNLYQLALENQEREETNKLKENLTQIYRKDKDFLDVSLLLARIYSREKSFDKKHINIILEAFSSKTNQFLRNDEDGEMVDHLHNHYKSKHLFSEEIDFLKEVLKNKHPYNEGKLNSWIAIDLIEKGELDRARELLETIDPEEAGEDLLDGNIRLSEELLYKEKFKEAEEILEKIYLIDPTYKNVGTILENFRKERIGRFALMASIGSGANATVYKAFDLVTRNYVAVKSLHKDLYTDNEALSNFKKEYEILEECIHPGIAKVIPGSFNDNYFALELLDKSLANVLENHEKGLDINEFFSIATQIVEALHYMHSKNIIYHDLAPDNVMFAGDMVKFCDLGGAKKFDLKTKETIIGSTEKHYLYASPEQCKHEFDSSVKVDHRSDIYSLGALMYQMLKGVPPFVGPDQALISAHQHSKPAPVISAEKNIPRQLTAIIMKDLEKNPDDRHQSMEELLQELMQTPRG